MEGEQMNITDEISDKVLELATRWWLDLIAPELTRLKKDNMEKNMALYSDFSRAQIKEKVTEVYDPKKDLNNAYQEDIAAGKDFATWRYTPGSCLYSLVESIIPGDQDPVIITITHLSELYKKIMVEIDNRFTNNISNTNLG